MSVDQRIEAATDQLEVDVGLNHQITHGDNTTIVQTEGGPVSSISKQLTDIETEWAKTADPLAEDLASAVQLTESYRTEAGQSAATAEAELGKVQAEGAAQLQAVNTAGNTQLQAVNSAGSSQLSEINSRGAEQIQLASDEADRSTEYSIISQQASQACAESESQSALSASNAASSEQSSADSQQAAQYAAVESQSILDEIGSTLIGHVTHLIRTQTIVVQHHAFS